MRVYEDNYGNVTDATLIAQLLAENTALDFSDSKKDEVYKMVKCANN